MLCCFTLILILSSPFPPHTHIHTHTSPDAYQLRAFVTTLQYFHVELMVGYTITDRKTNSANRAFGTTGVISFSGVI